MPTYEGRYVQHQGKPDGVGILYKISPAIIFHHQGSGQSGNDNGRNWKDIYIDFTIYGKKVRFGAIHAKGGGLPGRNIGTQHLTDFANRLLTINFHGSANPPEIVVFGGDLNSTSTNPDNRIVDLLANNWISSATNGPLSELSSANAGGQRKRIDYNWGQHLEPGKNIVAVFNDGPATFREFNDPVDLVSDPANGPLPMKISDHLPVVNTFTADR